ncbi:carbohydrate-binding protein [Catellatospora sp. KI3]|uniref:carbohydrate-binding protein n=1 Tax=Catellatospora sp. KI3 TaxID=3041620 RepID=UPI0024828074|nr:carbohydrate-binding protein [Catellatospora sp. KI3]MDI1464571.1 carbohydrate-binding protein [Catellatospora sp. KI3]
MHRSAPRNTLRIALATAAAAATALVTGVLAALPAEAASTTYQAESAALAGGTAVATDHTGYTGSGFVGGYTDGNKGNANTTFTVGNSGAASRTLTLRYANGTTQTKTLSLYVNGAKQKQISLNATANWDSWGTQVETVSLPNGSATVSYRFDTADSGNVNLDSLTVADIAAPPAGQYEAESAALSGGAAVATDHPGYTGSGFVGGYTDGNKGNANTSFTVNVSGAGSRTVTLRYANGTGATMTLSLYANGTKIGQVGLPATANWDTWGTFASSVNLTNGSNTVAYRFDTTDSGNVNIDNITVSGAAASPSASPSPSPSPSPTGQPGGQPYELETGFLSGGTSAATSTAGYNGGGYVTGLTAVGARVIRTVNSAAAGSFATTLRYANTNGASRTVSVYVNDLKTGQLTLPAGSGWLTVAQNLTLRAGLNIVAYQYDSGDSGNVQLDTLYVTGGAALAARGATVPYTTYEAENGSTNASVVGPNRTYLTEASEASGRKAVKLSSTGQYVQVTLTKPANALVIRYSIPDNAGGTGQTAPLALYNGSTKVADVTLSSVYSWVYGAYPYNNNPAGGEPHRFFDEVRVLLPGTYAAGTVVKLQKDASSSAAYYTIDLVEGEVTPAALTQPTNFLPVTDYGAVANDAGDDTNAFNSAISAAQSQGKGVWVPAGTFVVNARINIANVSLRGAGEWYTVIKGTNGKGGFFATGSNVRLADFTLAGDVRYRDDSAFDTAIEGNFGTGSLVHHVWIEHTKVGMWPTTGTNGLYAVGVRIRNTFADGVNVNGGANNVRIDQSVLRNTGDDALAMWSNSAPVANSAFTFNTVSLPMLANGAAIYGGTANRIEDNLITDSVYAGAGIAISTWHGAQAFSGTTSVQRNTLTRTSSFERNWNSSLGGLWIYAEATDITAPVLVKDVDIIDSQYQGILLSYLKNITNLTLDHVTVNGAGTYGIELNAAGSAYVTYVTVSGAASGGLVNRTGYTLNRGPGNSGF